jgi:hypothetical protein
VESWQCKQVFLACCYDTGYAPFLGQFASDTRLLNRITLLQGNLPSSNIPTDFKTLKLNDVFVNQQNLDATPNLSDRFNQITPNRRLSPIQQRFGPIQNIRGKRVDKDLSVNPEVPNRLGRLRLCYFLFLRGECVQGAVCSSNHDHRPLSDEEWCALWWLARKNRCFKAKKNIFCDDVMCVYGHN